MKSLYTVCLKMLLKQTNNNEDNVSSAKQVKKPHNEF